MGRWVRVDPLGFRAGDPNFYRDQGNNPMNHTDPSGLMWHRIICIYERESLPVDEYTKFASGRRRGIRLSGWEFKNQTFMWKGVRYCGDIEAAAYAERRFKSTVAFGDDKILANFATFIRAEYEFTHLRRIEGGKTTKVPDFKDGYWLPVKLVGVFIEPTINKFTGSFRPTSFATFEKEFIAGLNKLPQGHPEDRK